MIIRSKTVVLQRKLDESREELLAYAVNHLRREMQSSCRKLSYRSIVHLMTMA